MKIEGGFERGSEILKKGEWETKECGEFTCHESQLETYWRKDGDKQEMRDEM